MKFRKYLFAQWNLFVTMYANQYYNCSLKQYIMQSLRDFRSVLPEVPWCWSCSTSFTSVHLFKLWYQTALGFRLQNHGISFEMDIELWSTDYTTKNDRCNVLYCARFCSRLICCTIPKIFRTPSTVQSVSSKCIRVVSRYDTPLVEWEKLNLSKQRKKLWEPLMPL